MAEAMARTQLIHRSRGTRTTLNTGGFKDINSVLRHGAPPSVQISRLEVYHSVVRLVKAFVVDSCQDVVRTTAGTSLVKLADGTKGSMINLAIIGDIHHCFTEADVAYFNESAYDLILLVGDLSTFKPKEGYRLARRIAALQKPALAVPGNHDTVNLIQLLAEIRRHRLLIEILGLGQASRTRRLQASLNGVQLGGYSLNSFTIRGISFDVITARPFSMGGPALSFKPYLRRTYGVDTVASSAQLLTKLVDRSASDRLIFLGHNGPYGQGASRSAIWGCDFVEEEGDYGDVDLQMAVTHAISREKQVLAVVAGHMHHKLKGGGTRQWRQEADGTLYVNAARVPRIFGQSGARMHHHVRLSFNGARAEAEQQLVPAPKKELMQGRMDAPGNQPLS